MPATTSERLRLLREHHVPHLTSGQQHCLGYLVLGYRNSEAGAELEIAPSTFRRHIGEASHRVFDPLGLVASRELLATWFWLHTEDCTASVLEMIEHGTLGRQRRN